MNNKEAVDFTGEDNVILTAKKLQKLGPKIVVIKKGEHGVYLRYENKHFALPAFPMEKVLDIFMEHIQKIKIMLIMRIRKLKMLTLRLLFVKRGKYMPKIRIMSFFRGKK